MVYEQESSEMIEQVDIMSLIPTPLELVDVKDIEVFAHQVLRDANVEIDDELMEQFIEDLAEEQIKAESALAQLGSLLESKFRDFSRRRGQKELEWVNALLQFAGKDYMYGKTKKELIFGDNGGNDKPVVNITRQKVNLAIARMRDIQFPLGGDHNFRIVPHPDINDELMLVSDDPQQQQMAQNQLAEEYEKSRRMEETIVNQLVKAKYGNKAREAMRDWVLLGTAVMKGPVMDVDRKKMYNMIQDAEGGIVADLNYQHNEFPNTFRVDPKYFYPHPDTLVPEDLCEAIELHPLPKSKLIDLKHNENFIRRKLQEVVEQEPEGISGIGNLNELAFLTTDADLKDRYILKEYHGPIPKEPLMDLGIITPMDVEDALQEFYGEVWFVNGCVIRVSLEPIEGYDQTPYHVVPWDKDDGSLFGHGMPYMMRDAQRVARSAWQMLLDNAGLSSGPQMVVHREMIKPADGRWEIAPHKLWYFTEYGGNVQEAFQFFNVPNNQQQISNVIETAMQFGDLESESPMIMQNLVPQANNTASGQAMMLTIGNVTQRDKSQQFDDYVTRPLIDGYLHWNMQFNDDPSIKGNFDIEVSGATESIDAQLRAQEVERILALAAQNQEYSLHINSNEAFREIVTASRVGKRILRSQEEVAAEMQRLQEEAANAPPDPDQTRAEAVLMREQARQAELEAENAWRQSELELKQRLAQLEFEKAQMEHEAQLMKTLAEKEMQVMTLAIQTDTEYSKLAQQFDLKTLAEQVKLAIQESRNSMHDEEIKIKARTGSGI